MTVVVALRAHDGVWIGADQLQCSGEGKYLQPCVKWYEDDDWWLAPPGNAALGGLLLGEIERDRSDLTRAWLATLEEAGRRMRAVDMSENDRNGGGRRVVAVRKSDGEIRIIDAIGFEIVCDAPPWCAVGSGGPGARGALHALWNLPSSPGGSAMMHAAIEAAIALDSGCGNGVFVRRVA